LSGRLRIGSIADTSAAYVTALRCLADHEPFRGTRFGPVARTVEAAVRRGHVIFSYDETRTYGVACWILVSNEAAERWRREGIEPKEDGRDGDVVVILLATSEHPLGVYEGMRTLAKRYPNKDYMFARLGGKKMQTGRLARFLPD